MKSYEFQAVTYKGQVYCTECLPGEALPGDPECYPIFANAELDSVPTCTVCGLGHNYMTIVKPDKPMTTGHTARAMKAARQIAPRDHAHIAAIIDRETGLPELIDICRRLDAWGWAGLDNVPEPIADILKSARAALAKYEGKE